MDQDKPLTMSVPAAGRKYFNLGDDRRMVCGISFGYPDHDHIVNSYRTSRAKLGDAVKFVGE